MKHPAILLAFGLLLAASLLVTYRILWLGYPVFPAVPGKTWQVKVETLLETKGQAFTITMGLPSEERGRKVLEEKVVSGPLSFSLSQRGANRLGVWEGNSGTPVGEQQITYSATIVIRPRTGLGRVTPPVPVFPEGLAAEDRLAAERLASQWRSLAPDARITAILKNLAGSGDSGAPPVEQRVWWPQFQKDHGRTFALLAVMSAAAIPARPVEGLLLIEGIFPHTDHWIDLWNGRKWIGVNPHTGEPFDEAMDRVPLVIGGTPAIQVSGAEIRDVRWSLARNVVSQWRLHFEGIRNSTAFLDRWSLFRLPPEFQGTFRILLLVPIGALLICILRNIVGFPTFGIFMPVLMAISFRMTGLFYGLGIFGGVLVLGYWARRFLDRFHLLLVPRMSILLTMVILCFTVVAMEGNKLGIRSFMAVGLLPFVILTMIIERFFGIVEEQGAGEAFLTSAGSTAVAIITYAIIAWESLQLTFFIYPELLLAIAGVQMLIGRYTGYRLSEFIRFRAFKDAP